MPNYTETLQLIKPTEEEFYNIAVPNANMDALDSYIKELREQNALLREELANKANIDTVHNWLELELLNGWSASGIPYIMKDNAGWVHIFGTIMREAAPEPNEVFAELPMGYKPSKRLPILMNQGGGSGWSTYGWIQESGAVMFFPSSMPTNYQPSSTIGFNAVFKAAL